MFFKKHVRLFNYIATAMLILIPSMYFLYGIDGWAAITWGPAIVFWVFLVIHRLHRVIESSLIKVSDGRQNIRQDASRVKVHQETQYERMKRERGF